MATYETTRVGGGEWGTQFVVTKTTPDEGEVARYQVNFYKATGKADCTCLGFKYHGKCKHVKEVEVSK